MKKIAIILFLSLFSGIAFSQKISGVIKNIENKPVAGASVTLHGVRDSAALKINVTDKTGQFVFTAVAPGTYFIAISSMGYSDKNSKPLEIRNGDLQVETIALEKSAANLQEVVIKSKKPMIEIRADKTIFNVENSINAVGSDAMELLRKSPGVVVDRDDNIIMSGKNGVTIYIDGRLSPLSGAALSAYLRSLPSTAIEAIEIITNPSAKYDAAGNAGIINIRLKKNSNFGTNGSVTTGAAFGFYPKYFGGFNLNHRNSHINIYGGYNYNHNKTQNKLYVERTQSDTSFAQHSTTTNLSVGHNFKTGLDYFINKKNTLGVIVTGNIDDRNTGSYSKTPIIYAPTKVIDRWLVADNRNEVNNASMNTNVNFKHTEASGKDLEMNADYGHYTLRSNQFQPNYYYNPAFTTIIDRRIYQMVTPSDISIFSYRADYEQNFKKGKLGLGGKFSYVNSQNDFNQYNVYTSSNSFDSARSNNFVYKENINALYFNYNRQFKSIMIQIGGRMENSNVTGISTGYTRRTDSWDDYDSSFKRNYTNFFPSAAFTFNKNPNSQWGVTYSRRIDRPAYQSLNPFEVKIDEYSYYKGNTDLKPQYTNSIGLSNSFHNALNTSLNYSVVKDVFTKLMDTTESVKSFLISKNIATQKVLSLNISYNFQKDWYSLFTNVNSYYSLYKADFGNGRKIDLSVMAVTIYLQQSAKLGNGWSAEMSGYYNSPSIWNGTFKSREIYGIDAGIQKTLMKGSANLRLTFSDVFRTQWWRGVSDFVGQRVVAEYRWEAQQLKLNFTYRFGNSQVKAARQRKTTADEEGKRVQSGGGLAN